MSSQGPDYFPNVNDFRYFLIEDTWYLQQYKNSVDGWNLVGTFPNENEVRYKIRVMKEYLEPQNAIYVKWNEKI
jgi:hypothetical protein